MRWCCRGSAGPTFSRSGRWSSTRPVTGGDAEGSRLFEEITSQPEYYQTGAERGILERRSAEIVARTGCRELVELGSGSASKTGILIEAMLTDGLPARYVPLDV